MRRVVMAACAAACLMGQAGTPFKVNQSSGSFGGQLWLQEPRAGGTSWLKLLAGAMGGDVEFTLPVADGTAGQCLQTNGSGVWSFGACSAVSAPLVLTQAAGGYVEPLKVENSAIGVNGSCIVVASTDSGSAPVISAGRFCGRYDTASYSDELVTIQTPTGAGTWQNAIEIKNQNVTVLGQFSAGASNLSSLTMAGSQTPGFDGLGNVGTTGTRYGAMHTYLFSAADTATFEEIRASAGSTYSIGQTGTRFLRLFVDGITTGGPTYFENGSNLILRPTNTFTIDACTTVGHVLTAGASGVMTCAASASQWTSAGSDIHFATGEVSIGTTTIDSRLTVADDSTIPAAVTGTVLHVTGTTAQNTRILVDAFAGQAVFTGRRANGVPGTPSAVLSGNPIFSFTGAGYGATAYSSSGRTGFFGIATENWSDSAQGAYLSLRSTSNGSTTLTERWNVEQGGHFTAGADNTYDIGASGARRPRNYYGAGTMDVAGNLSAAVINATGSPAYRVSGTSVIDASRNATFVNLTLSGSVASDLIPSVDSAFVIGNSSFQFSAASIDTINAYSIVQPDTDGGADLGTSSNKWANSHFNTVNIYATIIPDTSVARNLGSSTRLWLKTFTSDIRIDGTVTAPNGNAGVSATGAACVITAISGGIITGATC